MGVLQAIDEGYQQAIPCSRGVPLTIRQVPVLVHPLQLLTRTLGRQLKPSRALVEHVRKVRLGFLGIAELVIIDRPVPFRFQSRLFKVILWYDSRLGLVFDLQQRLANLERHAERRCQVLGREELAEPVQAEGLVVEVIGGDVGREAGGLLGAPGAARAPICDRIGDARARDGGRQEEPFLLWRSWRSVPGQIGTATLPRNTYCTGCEPRSRWELLLPYRPICKAVRAVCVYVCVYRV